MPNSGSRAVIPGGQAALYIAAFGFAFVNLFVKLAGASFHPLFVSGARFAMGIVLALAALGLRRVRIDRRLWPDVILRGFFGALSMTATYAAINLTGPGRGALLSNSYPGFVTIFGALFFGEKPGKRVIVSLALCVLGSAFVMRDGSGASLAGDLLALFASLTAGVAVNFVRRASKAGADPFLLYLSPSVFGLPILFFAPFPTAVPGLLPILFLLGVGVLAFAAQALMALGYRTVSAAKGSVTFFLETGLTVILGLLFAGEHLTLGFALGLALIFAGLWWNRGRPSGPAPGAAAVVSPAEGLPPI